MLENKNLKIINFLQDFGCATIRQLQILFDRSNDNFKNILTSNYISKKEDILVYNNSVVNYKMLSAIDVLCQYKDRLSHFHKGFDPVYITFLRKDNNLLYNIIVTDKANEQGVLKLIQTNSTSIPDADKFIILFQDDTCLNKIECSVPYMYCTYPDLKIWNKRKIVIVT